MDIYDEAKAFRMAIQAVVQEGKEYLNKLDGSAPLHNFPSGSCGLVSTLFAYYLSNNGHEAKEISISIDKGSFDVIKTHAWVQSGDKYIDLTASQFKWITDEEIVIQSVDSSEWLVSLRNEAEKNGDVYINDPELETGSVDYTDLYEQVVQRMGSHNK